jgi:hypothetical protein
VEDLERLEQLRIKGILTEDEFESAKRRLLNPDLADDKTTRDRHAAAVNRLEQDWREQQRTFMVQERSSQRLPSSLAGWTILLFSVVAGIGVTFLAFAFSLPHLLLLSALLIVGGVGRGISEIGKAQEYVDARRRFEATRASAWRSKR